jgi:hypothetical protein
VNWTKTRRSRMNLEAIDKFHKTRLGYMVFGLVELGLSLAFANWALDNGSLLLWGLTLILAVGFAQNFVQMLVRRNG